MTGSHGRPELCSAASVPAFSVSDAHARQASGSQNGHDIPDRGSISRPRDISVFLLCSDVGVGIRIRVGIRIGICVSVRISVSIGICVRIGIIVSVRIIVAVVAGIPLGVTQLPAGIVSGLDFSSFGAPFLADEAGVMGIAKVVTNPTLLVFAFSLMMSDFFDTMGTAMAVAKQGEFLEPDGRVQNIKEILIVDSAAAAVGGLVGASSITTFVESASGAADGGRTGLSSVVAGLLFIVAAFFSPLISVVSSAATCGALVFVGYLMMSEVTEIDWSDLLEGLPAFLIVAGVPLTYSISNGIGFGFIAYVVVAAVTGQLKKVKPLMWVAALAFLVYFLVV